MCWPKTTPKASQTAANSGTPGTEAPRPAATAGGAATTPAAAAGAPAPAPAPAGAPINGTGNNEMSNTTNDVAVDGTATATTGGALREL